MRNFTIYLLATIALLPLLCSCERGTKILYLIEVNDINCTAEAKEEIEITYRLHESILSSDVRANITTDADWVTIDKYSKLGKFYVNITENTGDTRIANISISVEGCKTATMTLTQWGAPPAEANQTLMYLFMGTSLSRYFDNNLKDASYAIGQGILGNNNRVLFFRQENTSKGYIGEICFVSDNECIERRLVENIAISDSQVTPEEVSQFIATMAELAPSKRYGLICAGHGQGWLPRDVVKNDADISKFGVDYAPWVKAEGAEVTRAYGEAKGMLNIPELASAIELSGVELDYILFDACFMSNIETVYDLRNLAKYIIASPCEIMGKGFPYDKTLPHLFLDEGMTSDYAKAAESYYIYYRDDYNQTARSGSVTLFDCSEIEALAEATKSVMSSATEDYDKSQLQTYEGERVHHFYDFGEWVNVVATDKEALAQFNAQFDECIIATYTLSSFYSAYGQYGTYPINLDVYTGVTTSAPSDAFPKAWRETNWYNYVWGE